MQYVLLLVKLFQLNINNFLRRNKIYNIYNVYNYLNFALLSKTINKSKRKE